MARNKCLSKSIYDSSWSTFFHNLSYKAENAGKIYREVSAYGTSQSFSKCTKIVNKTLAIRTHRCNCGLELDRNYNASLNINQKGLRLLQELQEVTPQEIGSIQTTKCVLQIRSLSGEETTGHRPVVVH